MRKENLIDRKRSLEGIPVLNEGVQVRGLDEDRVIITVRLKRGSGFLARFQPPVMERNVKLDEIGTFVFRQIDGKRTIRQIIDAFMARYQVNRREAEMSCAAFVKSLVSRHVISIVIR